MSAREATLSIDQITVDPRLQSRVALDPGTIADYADQYRAGTAMAPVTVFFDGSTHWLADGFHRAAAVWKAGLAEIAADIRDGSFRDALRHAIGANVTHGLRRTNADKRRAIEMALADEEWRDWSDNRIGKHCGVTHDFVAKVRSLATVASESTSSRVKIYTNKHGSVSTMRVTNIGRRNKPTAPSLRDIDVPQPQLPGPAASSAPTPPGPLVCPFCGYDQYRVEGIEYDMFAALCYRCNARGPAGRDENEAESVWFQRFLPGS